LIPDLATGSRKLIDRNVSEEFKTLNLCHPVEEEIILYRTVATCRALESEVREVEFIATTGFKSTLKAELIIDVLPIQKPKVKGAGRLVYSTPLERRGTGAFFMGGGKAF